MSSYLADQLADLRREVAALKASQVTYVEAPVTAVDTPGSTFAVTVGGQQDGKTLPLAGIAAPAQFLPATGETVRLAVAGAQPIYQPGGIAENAITAREIAPGSVPEEALAFDISTLGGTTVFYGSTTPTAGAYGDLWLKVITTTGNVPQYETRRWTPGSPDSWVLLADQKVTQALVDAAAANDKAVAAQTSATAAANQAAGKTTTFRQTEPPPTLGRTLGDEWIDTDNGNKRSVWDTQASVSRTNLIPNPSFEGGLTGWAGTRATASVDSSKRRSGTSSAKLTVTDPVGPEYLGPTVGIPVTPGVVYTASFYVMRDATATNVQVDLTFYDAAGAGISTTSGAAVAVSNTTWSRISGTATAPAGAATVLVKPVVFDLAAGRVFWVDDALLEASTTVGSYFDGNSGGEAIWNGTPNAATSTTWVPTTVTAGWQPALLRSGAIEPKSLVASNVVATGTVTAALLEAVLVLATQVIAGTPGGSRVEIDKAGVRLMSSVAGAAPVVDMNTGTGNATFRGTVEGALFKTSGDGQRLEIQGGGMAGGRTVTFYPAGGGLPATVYSRDDRQGNAGVSLAAGGAAHGFLNFTSTFADVGYTNTNGTASFIRTSNDPYAVAIGVATTKSVSITCDSRIDFYTGNVMWGRLGADNSMERITKFALGGGPNTTFTFGGVPGAVDADIYAQRFVSTNAGATGGFIYYSDERLKRNIRGASFPALQQVLATPIREFEWARGGSTDVGFVAQEVPAGAQVELSPDAPIDGVADPVGVSAERMLITLWKAVQELAGPRKY